MSFCAVWTTVSVTRSNFAELRCWEYLGWCSQEDPRHYVQEHLKELVIKPAFPRFGQHPEFPELMSAAACEGLARRIEAQPDEFVAQERVALSTVPARTENGIVPRHAVLRVYAAWDGHSFVVLPGGLT